MAAAATEENKRLFDRATAQVTAKVKKVALGNEQAKGVVEWLVDLVQAFPEHRDLLEKARDATDIFCRLIQRCDPPLSTMIMPPKCLAAKGELSLRSWLDVLAETFPQACLQKIMDELDDQESRDMWRILLQQHELENTPENIDMVLTILRGHGNVSFRFLHGNATMSHTTIVLLPGKRFLVWRAYAGACVISASDWEQEFGAIRQKPSGDNDLGLTQGDAGAMLPLLQRVVEEVLPFIAPEQEPKNLTETQIYVGGRVRDVFIFADRVFHFKNGHWRGRSNGCIAITGAAGWTMPDSPHLTSYDDEYIAEKLAMYRLKISKEEIYMHIRSLKALSILA